LSGCRAQGWIEISGAGNGWLEKVQPLTDLHKWDLLSFLPGWSKVKVKKNLLFSSLMLKQIKLERFFLAKNFGKLVMPKHGVVSHSMCKPMGLDANKNHCKKAFQG
jgi:hypothetical protein